MEHLSSCHCDRQWRPWRLKTTQLWSPNSSSKACNVVLSGHHLEMGSAFYSGWIRMAETSIGKCHLSTMWVCGGNAQLTGFYRCPFHPRLGAGTWTRLATYTVDEGAVFFVWESYLLIFNLNLLVWPSQVVFKLHQGKDYRFSPTTDSSSIHWLY